MGRVIVGVALAAAGLVAALVGQSELSFVLILLGAIVGLPAMRDLSNPLLGGAFPNCCTSWLACLSRSTLSTAS